MTVHTQDQSWAAIREEEINSNSKESERARERRAGSAAWVTLSFSSDVRLR